MTSTPMTRRTVLKGTAAAAALAAAPIHPIASARGRDRGRPKPSDRPNFIVIMTDDQGYGDLSSYGAPLTRTPNIDGLGDRGMRFTQHYAGSPLCSPSRAALLTGGWPPRVNIPNVLNPDGLFGPQPNGIAAQETLLPEYLKQAGYATAIFGKWHLGDRFPQYHPLEHGFDRWVGIPYSNDYPTIPLYDDYDVIEEIIYPGSLTPNPGPGDDQDYLTSLLFDEAAAWIDDHADEPFFCYIPTSQPHEPLASEYDGSPGGPHGSAIEEIDQFVGDMLDQLDRLRIRDNTCIIFTSDNGPWWVGDTGGAYGRKGETYDGGIKVPMVMDWPAMFRRGRRYDRPTAHVDILPTLCAAAGVSLTDRPIDGQSLMPAVGTGRSVPATPIAYYQGTNLNAMRFGAWKLHVQRVTNVLPRFTGRLGWDATEEMPQLFNLDDDPGEHYDLSEHNPELTTDLMQRLAAFDTDLKADHQARYGT